MRSLLLLPLFTSAIFGLTGCDNKDDKTVEAKPAFDLVPQREQLQKAKDLEKKMQEDAEERRKVIEAQTNPK